jgi:2-polyprenyl-3-methyl-5-hydroxy-6-metoxy-1,4-benzoquinol methylase
MAGAEAPHGAAADQLDSGGISIAEIVDATLQAADPEPGLSWLDIGCGTGDLLRRVRDELAPAALRGVDLIDWLAPDLRGDVAFTPAAIEEADGLTPADRVMLVEVIEHLPAPWTALRRAAQLVAPGGRIVVSTPNIASLRSRLELAVRGNLTSFRPGYTPHMSPALPHVIAHVLQDEGIRVGEPTYAGADVISLTGGRVWPAAARARWPRLTSISVIVSGRRDPGRAV